MGTHAVKKDWTGADAVVRKYFPEDYQGTLNLLNPICYNDVNNASNNYNYEIFKQWQGQSLVSTAFVLHWP